MKIDKNTIINLWICFIIVFVLLVTAIYFFAIEKRDMNNRDQEFNEILAIQQRNAKIEGYLGTNKDYSDIIDLISYVKIINSEEADLYGKIELMGYAKEEMLHNTKLYKASVVERYENRSYKIIIIQEY